MTKLLLIRGLGHSGTTILDLALGAHPQVVGLGEAARILQKPTAAEAGRGPARLRGDLRFERRCTCGEVAVHCPIWGPILDWLPAHDDWSLADKMQRLLEEVERGRDPQQEAPTWVVDSYQDDMVLPLLKDPTIDIRILHLTRDVRSWVHSRSLSARKQGLWGSSVKPLMRWCVVNARHSRHLEGCGRQVFRLGYEQLALQPETSLQRICEWLAIPFDGRMLQPGRHSSSHILSGNRMRFDAAKSVEIRYDATWLQRPSGLAQMALFVPWVAQMNQRLVYSMEAPLVSRD